jgi:hypothetical protein
MHIAAIDSPTEASGYEGSLAAADPRSMTAAELREFGVSSLVYLKTGTAEGQLAFAIHGADGLALAVVDDIDLAVELVSAHGMSFVAVH